ncbi:MAG: serine/threonine-protein kinase [Polyangiaceae bacterium]
MTDQVPPARGLVAGKYEVVGLIGRGGMGSVWEGRHVTLGTRVAIKFVDPEHAGSAEARTRFDTEARAAATIQSKHAIQIFDHGVTDGRPYIVMELLLGESLDRRLDRLGRLPLVETARLIGQVCRALARAHDAGVIHRDLKPENVFVVRSPDEDEEIAKVLDFGIAKFKGPLGGSGLTSSTKTGAVLGTPYYMSPEQARGLRDIDQRTDLWSLGVIAYKCVTGFLPFDGESVGDLLVKICTAPLPIPSLNLPGLAPPFDAWFARALERDPQRRFATAAELAEALNAAAGVSQRRPPHDVGSMGAPWQASGPMVTPMAAGARTSTPFSAAGVPRTPSRGILVGALAAATIGGLVGVLTVARLAEMPKPARPALAAAASEGVGPVDLESLETPMKGAMPPTGRLVADPRGTETHSAAATAVAAAGLGMAATAPGPPRKAENGAATAGPFGIMTPTTASAQGPGHGAVPTLAGNAAPPATAAGGGASATASFSPAPGASSGPSLSPNQALLRVRTDAPREGSQPPLPIGANAHASAGPTAAARPTPPVRPAQADPGY